MVLAIGDVARVKRLPIGAVSVAVILLSITIILLGIVVVRLLSVAVILLLAVVIIPTVTIIANRIGYNWGYKKYNEYEKRLHD